MALIKKCLEGNQLPPSIPPSFLQEPISSFLEPRKLSVTEAPTALGLVTNGADSNEWSIPPNSRPKYRLQFNQNDRTKCGYLTGVEARGISMSPHLPQSTLAYIWNLADIDNDSNLTGNEFRIAAYLIDQALAGRTSPPPPHCPLLLSRYRLKVNKRMQNFLLGQAEMDRRKQDLTEKLRQDDEARREQARLEAEKQEKLRLEQERRRQKEAEKEAEHQRNLEAQREARRQQATAAHIQALKEAQRQKALELEKARVEALAKERAAEAAALEQAKTLRASLLEAAASLATRRQTLEVRLSEVQSEYEGHRRAILEMGDRRDALERESVDLSERVEAGRAELHRWQREHEQLSLRVTTSVDANQAPEHHKTLVNDMRQLNESKQQLEHRLTDLNSRDAGGPDSSLTSTSGQGAGKDSCPSFDELALTVGDKILIHKSPREGGGDGWLYGELNGKRGLVPATYVKSQSAHQIFPAAISDPFVPVMPSQTETGDSALVASATVDEDQKRLTSTATPLFTCIALYDFKGHLPGDLSLKSAFTAAGVGQLTLVAKQYVKVQRKSASGWWEGEIQQRGQDRQSWAASGIPHSAPTTTTTANKSLVQAKYAYKAAQPDELTFEENALIEVLNHEEEGWWRGRLTASGVEGLFPVNYVQPYNNAAVDGTSGGQFDSPKTAAASSSAPKPC
nr:unnamed protein product [Spirometra erinaceieuropaei]